MFLFFGDSADQVAREEIQQHGVMLDSFGEGGLRVDESRQIVDLLLSTPMGDQTSFILIGPMDKSSPQASDVLLKVLEESGEGVIPYLWATDVDGVSGTIRSRCVLKFCGQEESVDDLLGSRLYSFIMRDDIHKVISLCEEHKGEIEILLRSLCAYIRRKQSKEGFLLWSNLRPLLGGQVTHYALLSGIFQYWSK